MGTYRVVQTYLASSILGWACWPWGVFWCRCRAYWLQAETWLPCKTDLARNMGSCAALLAMIGVQLIQRRFFVVHIRFGALVFYVTGYFRIQKKNIYTERQKKKKQASLKKLDAFAFPKRLLESHRRAAFVAVSYKIVIM